ncbi:MAG: type II secretion system protein GspL, partial [Nitrococcus sp.]|nr:type II secretion system protein GspL [Nitrococcus sp.]
MRPRLILRLPADPGALIEWIVLDTNGRPEGASRRGTPAEAAAEAAGRQVLGLADGLAVLLSDTVIPSRNGERLRRAVPFALEERLAGDVDSLHFALGRREPGGRVRV